MSCQQVPTTPAFNPYPRSVQVGEFEVAIGGGIWVAIRERAQQCHSFGQKSGCSASTIIANCRQRCQLLNHVQHILNWFWTVKVITLSVINAHFCDFLQDRCTIHEFRHCFHVD